ncbi:MAG TPA: dTMP kinase [Acidobacteriota bacterium]|nr:MAG: dTMP kinase [candidate division KSB1 bacterium RBG_16_48_16]
MSRGLFITFEGIDNSGKSVQVERFAGRLKESQVVVLRDPGATAISEKIRHILLDNDNYEMSAWTELLLYEAARAQMVEQLIKPALAKQSIVVCDRFYDSTTTYQGYGRGLNLKLVKQANKIGACGLTPDLTFIIDVEPEIALQRSRKNKTKADRLESEGIQFQNRVRQGYLKIADEEKERIVVVNGHLSVEEIHKNIWDIFLQRIGNPF